MGEDLRHTGMSRSGRCSVFVGEELKVFRSQSVDYDLRSPVRMLNDHHHQNRRTSRKVATPAPESKLKGIIGQTSKIAGDINCTQVTKTFNTCAPVQHSSTSWRKGGGGGGRCALLVCGL